MKASYVDLDSGKIIGAKKYSLAWWHEMGHLEFSKKDIAMKITYWNDMLFFLVIFFVALKLNLISLICLLIIVGMYHYEEKWCWNYAKKMKQNKARLK